MERSFAFVLQNQGKHPNDVRIAKQRCDEIWSSAVFVCGKTGLYLKKGNLVEALSTPSLQVESIFTVAHNMEKVKRTSLCFLCSYVKMGAVRSQYEKMND